MKVLLVLTFISISAAVPVSAQPDVVVACTPDVIRLCNPTQADASDHRRIAKCIRANWAQMSPECRAAVKEK
jgi:hypothetical protein